MARTGAASRGARPTPASAKRAQVVEVEQRDAGEVGDAGIDVAGHGDVDDQQRPVGAARP